MIIVCPDINFDHVLIPSSWDYKCNISDIESYGVSIWQQTFQTFSPNLDEFGACKVLKLDLS